MGASLNTLQQETMAAQGSAAEVFGAFLKLGLTSFGGPIAHLGYFRTEFVERRRWLDDRSYADLVALCQFLPSSRPAARLAWHWDWAARAGGGCWRHGPDSPCHRPWR